MKVSVQWPWGWVCIVLLLAVGCGRDTPAPVAVEPQGVPTLQIDCHPDSLAAIHMRPHEDLYVDARLRMDGHTWEHVRLRLRGDSSRDFPKKSMKIKLPKSDSLPFGRRVLNLNAEYLDRSYLRQQVCTQVWQRAGHPCFDTRHVQVMLNGENHGIFLLVEGVDESFFERRGMPVQTDLFKATKDSACLSHHDVVRAYWERKLPENDTSFSPIDSLIRLLHDTPDAGFKAMVQANFDYELLINALAVNMLIGNRSTYYHNYYLYRDPRSRKWIYLPWDMDNTLLLKELDDLYHRGNNSDSHWSDMASNPLLERSLADAAMCKDVERRVAALAQDAFSQKFLFPQIDSLARTLRPFIAADTLYRKRTVADWQAEVEAVKAYISQRPAILLHQFAHCPTSFQLIENTAPLQPGDRLRWRPSTDPDHAPITYRVSMSLDKFYAEDVTLRFPALQDTSMAIPDGLAPGLYYWKVYAADGEYETRGFDNRSTFVIGGK